MVSQYRHMTNSALIRIYNDNQDVVAGRLKRGHHIINRDETRIMNQVYRELKRRGVKPNREV